MVTRKALLRKITGAARPMGGARNCNIPVVPGRGLVVTIADESAVQLDSRP